MVSLALQLPMVSRRERMRKEAVSGVIGLRVNSSIFLRTMAICTFSLGMHTTICLSISLTRFINRLMMLGKGGVLHELQLTNVGLPILNYELCVAAIDECFLVPTDVLLCVPEKHVLE